MFRFQTYFYLRIEKIVNNKHTVLSEHGCGGNGITMLRSKAQKGRTSGAHNDLLLLNKKKSNKPLFPGNGVSPEDSLH